MKIKNKLALTSHGNAVGRKLIIDIIEYTLEALNPRDSVRRIIRIENRKLKVDRLEYALSKIKDIYVLGAGKGSVFIAEAIEDVLGDRIKDGLIVEKKGQSRKLEKIRILEAGHPIPDMAGYKAARSMFEIAKQAKDGDIVFFCVTGGASALLPFPAGGINLKDKIEMTDMLLKSGAKIEEINAIRKHISSIKGGRLARHIHPAEIINLIVVDEVAGAPWGPTVPDNTTFLDAIYALKKYGLYDRTPSSIRTHLEQGLKNPALETPKSADFQDIKVHNIILSNAEKACEFAHARAKDLGLNSIILSTVIEGESREVGTVLAGIAKEIAKNRRPIAPPCAVISGGEMTVTIPQEPGEGGPNQEFVLSFSLMIDRNERIVVASIDTDGTDGPTGIAGGIVDGYTVERAEELNIDISEHVMKHNASYVLKRLKDAIYTGPTGTNVMNLRVIVILDSHDDHSIMLKNSF